MFTVYLHKGQCYFKEILISGNLIQATYLLAAHYAGSWAHCAAYNVRNTLQSICLVTASLSLPLSSPLPPSPSLPFLSFSLFTLHSLILLAFLVFSCSSPSPVRKLMIPTQELWWKSWVMMMDEAPAPPRWAGPSFLGRHSLPAHTWAQERYILLASTLRAPLDCWFKTPKGLQGLSAPEAKKGIWSHPPWPWTFYHASLLLLFVTFPITTLKCPARTSLSFWTPSSLKSFSKASLSWGMLSNSDTPSTEVQCGTAGYTKFTCGFLPNAQHWHLSITGLSLYFSPWRPVAATFHASQEWRCP